MDVYNYNESSSNYEGRILGDATAETKKWNGDYAEFVYTGGYWFNRGGRCLSAWGAGAFGFSRHEGGAGTGNGYRLVLAT